MGISQVLEMEMIEEELLLSLLEWLMKNKLVFGRQLDTCKICIDRHSRVAQPFLFFIFFKKKKS